MRGTTSTGSSNFGCPMVVLPNRCQFDEELRNENSFPSSDVLSVNLTLVLSTWYIEHIMPAIKSANTPMLAPIMI